MKWNRIEQIQIQLHCKTYGLAEGVPVGELRGLLDGLFVGLGDGFKLELGDCDRDNDGKKEGRNVAVRVGPTV